MKQAVWYWVQMLVMVVGELVSWSVLAAAQPPGALPPPATRLGNAITALGLDAATRGQVHQIVEASRAEHQRLRRELRAAYRHLRFLLAQEEPDEAAVMAQADAVGALRTALQKQRLRTMLQVRALLTPAQRAQLLEVLRAQRPRGPCRPHAFDD